LLNRNRYKLAVLCLAGLLPLQIAAQKEVEQSTVEQRLERMERLLSSQGLMDMLEQVRELQEEIRQLRGQIEVQNHKIDQLQQRQRNLYADIDQRMRRLESSGATAAAATPANAGGDEEGPPLSTLSPIIENSTAGRSSDSALTLEITGEESDNTEATNQSEQDNARAGETDGDDGTSGIQPAAIDHAALISPVQIRAQYQEALGLLKQSRYEQAIRKFTEFLSAFPDSEYSDNARYWLAEAHYVTRDFEPALKEYKKLVDQYPDSQKMTHGLLKIGYTLHELGRLDEARQQLQDLIEKYPGTTASRLAEERLQRINADAGAPD